MCLAQGHNAVTPVRLEPSAPRSRVKHSTTEPLRSLVYDMHLQENTLNYLKIGAKVTQTVAQYPPYHVIYASAKLEVATSNGLGGYAVTIKYIVGSS